MDKTYYIEVVTTFVPSLFFFVYFPSLRLILCIYPMSDFFVFEFFHFHTSSCFAHWSDVSRQLYFIQRLLVVVFVSMTKINLFSLMKFKF